MLLRRQVGLVRGIRTGAGSLGLDAHPLTLTHRFVRDDAEKQMLRRGIVGLLAGSLQKLADVSRFETEA